MTDDETREKGRDDGTRGDAESGFGTRGKERQKYGQRKGRREPCTSDKRLSNRRMITAYSVR